MPYIESKTDRELMDKVIKEIVETMCEKGSLNYFLCKLFNELELSYDTARKFIGEMECAKLELYRRWIAPYEDQKCEENGDV